MRISILLLLVFLTSAFGQSAAVSTTRGRSAATDNLAEQLVGAWRLIGVETIRPNGEVIYPYYGKHPEGLLIYDRSGWMSVQIVSDPKPAVPASDSREAFTAAAPGEKIIAVDGYYAYLGTWSADQPGSTVTHHIRQSLYPGEWGSNVVRAVAIKGNRLKLTAKTHEMGEDHQRQLTWERVTSDTR